MPSSTATIKIIDTVNDLKQDISSLNLLVGRLDVTLEKLTDVSMRVTELIAIQGNRIDNQEKISEQLQNALEQRRLESEKIYDTLRHVEKDINTEVDQHIESVVENIKELRSELQCRHDYLKTKVERLEKWMWTVVGAVSVIIFLTQFFI